MESIFKVFTPDENPFIASFDNLKIIIKKSRSKLYKTVIFEARKFNFCITENCGEKDEKHTLKFELFELSKDELSRMIWIISVVANWKDTQFFVNEYRHKFGTYNFLRCIEIYQKRGRLDAILSTDQVVRLFKKNS